MSQKFLVKFKARIEISDNFYCRDSVAYKLPLVDDSQYIWFESARWNDRVWCCVVRSPAGGAVNVDVLGAQFSTDLQFVVSICFYDEILGNELWQEFSARGEFSMCMCVFWNIL